MPQDFSVAFSLFLTEDISSMEGAEEFLVPSSQFVSVLLRTRPTSISNSL